jgi:hypothetical protein
MELFSTYNRHRLSFILMVAIFIVIIVYSYFKTVDIICGPQIIVISPSTGSAYADELALVKGRANRIAKIYLNDRQIFTDDEGYFNEPLLLFPGYNILTLRAHDSFGRTVTKRIQLVYQS